MSRALFSSRVAHVAAKCRALQYDARHRLNASNTCARKGTHSAVQERTSFFYILNLRSFSFLEVLALGLH